MKFEIIFVIFAILLVGTIQYQSFAQSNSLATHVVINEIDINPPGSDSLAISEWVELYNPTDKEVYIGNWEIASTTVLKKTMILPDGETIKPEQHLKYQYQSVWFTDVGERVELRDDSGNIVDETPTLSDLANDFKSWQRVYDGFDTDSSNDWEFRTSTAGSTNGKLPVEEIEGEISILVSTDKSNYIFDETAIISGTVSEQVFTEAPFFHQEPIELIITGPNYYKTITLYPNLFLEYETSIKLQKVLRINEGIYDVSLSYAGVTASTQFSVGTELIEIEQQEVSSLTITTDRDSYIPGETATIFAQTSEIVSFEGLKFEVLNAGGIQIYQGTLYPNVAAVNSAIGDSDRNPLPDAQFTTTIFMDTVSPSYGSHTIIAQYGTQAATGTFVLNEDVKEEKLISLRTDKPVYEKGETVLITGRLNNNFLFSMNIEILQTGTITFDRDIRSIKGNVIKEIDVVRLAGDSTFSYKFKIPNNIVALGEFRVKVSQDIGEETIFFSVVENIEDFVAFSDEPITVLTDKTIYEIGDDLMIFGRVSELQKSSTFQNPAVDISITREDGTPIIIDVLKPTASVTSAIFTLTGIPDVVGEFKVVQHLYAQIFDEGTYKIKATYANGKFSSTTSFSVVDPLNIDEPFLLQLNKEVFGLGETVLLDGIIQDISQGVGITITLIKPDGDTDKFGTLADNSKFSWSWETPRAEKVRVVTNERVVTSSNYGIYQIVIGSDSGDTNVFFKVSPNPEEDTLEIAPLQVTTDKPIYNAGETLTVHGTAMKRQQGMEGLVVQDRAQIIITSGEFPFKQIYEAFVYLDSGGNFKSSFKLHVTIFPEGNYKVKAVYQGIRDETLFQVDNDFVIGGDGPLVLLLNTDKDEYALGETVQISGRPSKLVYLENLFITVLQESDLQLTCGSFTSFVCGLPVASSSLRTSPSGSFTHEYTISTSSDDLGKYEVIVDTEFGEFITSFNVVEQISIQSDEIKEKLTGKRSTEKFNRIPDSFVPISIAAKTLDNQELLPRVLQGSLLTPIRGEEANVNIKITTQDGLCIIGQEAECFVTNSTRGPGTIYQIVEIDNVNYKIRYSGPDVRLEKFTILPESSSGTLPDSIWNVEVIKDEQPSRLYYKITYVTSE